MFAAPLYAAFAVCAALVQARATGTGRLLEVAELDAAASWQAEHLDAALNGVASSIPDMIPAVRYQYYRTRDDRVVVFQASERKFWRNFCTAVGRPDLFAAKPGAPAGDHARGDEALRAELAAIFQTRTRAEWVDFFIVHDVPGGPVHTADELPGDPHFRAREAVAGEVRACGRRVETVAADVATEAGGRLVVERAVARFGRVDVLVNNAGRGAPRRLLELTEADWQASFALNFMSAVRLSLA